MCYIVNEYWQIKFLLCVKMGLHHVHCSHLPKKLLKLIPYKFLIFRMYLSGIKLHIPHKKAFIQIPKCPVKSQWFLYCLASHAARRANDKIIDKGLYTFSMDRINALVSGTCTWILVRNLNNNIPI